MKNDRFEYRLFIFYSYLCKIQLWGCFGFDSKLNRNVSMPGVAKLARKSQAQAITGENNYALAA